MPTYIISGTLSPNGALATVTLSGDTVATVQANASGVYSFAGIVDLTANVITPSKAGVVFTPSIIAVAISGADSTGNNFTGVEQPIESFGEVAYETPGKLFVVIDNGPNITATVNPLAGVPKPNNPGAQNQGVNVYPNGTVPDFIPLSTTVSFGLVAQPIKFKNPA